MKMTAAATALLSALMVLCAAAGCLSGNLGNTQIAGGCITGAACLSVMIMFVSTRLEKQSFYLLAGSGIGLFTSLIAAAALTMIRSSILPVLPKTLVMLVIVLGMLAVICFILSGLFRRSFSERE